MPRASLSPHLTLSSHFPRTFLALFALVLSLCVCVCACARVRVCQPCAQGQTCTISSALGTKVPRISGGFICKALLHSAMYLCTCACRLIRLRTPCAAYGVASSPNIDRRQPFSSLSVTVKHTFFFARAPSSLPHSLLFLYVCIPGANFWGCTCLSRSTALHCGKFLSCPAHGHVSSAAASFATSSSVNADTLDGGVPGAASLLALFPFFFPMAGCYAAATSTTAER